MRIFGARTTPIANEHQRYFAFGMNDIAQATRFLKSRGMHWQDFAVLLTPCRRDPMASIHCFSRIRMDTGSKWVTCRAF
jgi:hypothetical protein